MSKHPNQLWRQARLEHPDNPDAANARYFQLMEEAGHIVRKDDINRRPGQGNTSDPRLVEDAVACFCGHGLFDHDEYGPCERCTCLAWHGCLVVGSGTKWRGPEPSEADHNGGRGQ